MRITGAKGAAAHLSALKLLDQMVQAQALTLTYNDVLMLMAGAFFIVLPLTFLLAKPTMGGAAEAH